MAQGDTPITLVGNLTADPELRYIQSGAAVANFTVASTPRRYDSQAGQWVDGEAMFLTCNVWRQAAENVANSLSKGDRVIVTGKLRQRSYENQQGEKRRVFEVEVDEVGPALRFATAQVTKSSPGGQNRGGGQGFGGQGFGGGAGAGQGGFQGQNQNQNQGGFQGQGGQGGQGSQGGQGQNQGFGGRNAANDSDPWNSAPQTDFGAGDDEPPF